MSEIKDYPPYLDYPKPRRKQTNGDRIRSMTDEELAVTIMCPYGFCVLDDEKAEEYGCARCTEDWLKQEVSE